MSGCIDELKKKGYNLEGYSPDFYAALEECKGNCEACFSWAQATYG